MPGFSRFGKRKSRNGGPMRAAKKAHRSIPRPPKDVVPHNVRVGLKYSVRLSLSPGASGASASTTLAANGVFDPGLAVDSASPMGFDQWAAFYSNNRVHASSIKVIASVIGSATNAYDATEMLVVYPSDNSSAASSIDAAVEQPRSSYMPLSIAREDSIAEQYTPGWGSSSHVARTSWKLTRDTSLGAKDDSVMGTSTANPGDLWYYHIVAGPLSSTQGHVIYLHALVTYDTEFFNPVGLARST